MTNIHTLAIHISPHLTSFFMYCMDRRITKKPNLYSTFGGPRAQDQNKILALPLLHDLTLNGNSSLLPLAPFRNLSHFEMTLFQTHKSLATALRGFDAGDGQQRMRSIRLRFHQNVDIASAAEAISKVLPRLEMVVLEQPHLRALLKHLVKTPTFSCLHRLHLNITDRFPKYWTKDDPDSVAARVLPIIEKLAKDRDQFRLVSFGRVAWVLRKGKFVEIPETLFDNEGVWYGNTFLGDNSLIRVWCQLDHSM
ncbi:hypothetical protein H1R20_g4515, partial [Candolleomyces eurysporus]